MEHSVVLNNILQQTIRAFTFFSLVIVGLIQHLNLSLKAIFSKSTQSRTLRRIVSKNAYCDYGKKMLFSRMRTYSDFTHGIEISEYETIRPKIEDSIQAHKNHYSRHKIQSITTTSGTTGRKKFILLAKRVFYTEYLSYIVAIVIRILLQSPLSLLKPISVIVAPQDKSDDYEVENGSSANKLYRKLQFTHIFSIPKCVFEIKDVEIKYYYIVLFIFKSKSKSIITPNPTTLLQLEEIDRKYHLVLESELKANCISNRFDLGIETWIEIEKAYGLYPAYFSGSSNEKMPLIALRLTLINWRSGASNFFHERLESIFTDSKFIDLGYVVSDSPFAIPLPYQNKQILHFDKVFGEFIEVNSANSKVLQYHELEVGKQYEVILTNDYGLYRYNIKDVIEIDGKFLNCFTFQFIRKSAGFSNITGEKLSDQQIREAIKSCQSELNINVSFYIFSANIKEQKYIAFIEVPSFENESLLSSTLDQLLSLNNIEYAAKRQSGRLNHLQVKLLPSNSFKKYKNFFLSQGRRDIQFKVNHLTCNQESLTEINNLYF